MKLKDEFLDGRLAIVVGDITQQEVDAIVNAANSTLLGGGGVDGAIHRVGGTRILEECRELRRTKYPHGLPAGEATITTAGNLPSKNVIHTVGPIYGRHGGNEPELLAACYKNSLMLAASHSLSSIAFPSISTGAFGYPRHEAAGVASRAIEEFLMNNDFAHVRLVFFKPSDMRTFVANQKFSITSL